jgi:hypothetical protein
MEDREPFFLIAGKANECNVVFLRHRNRSTGYRRAADNEFISGTDGFSA